MRIMKCPKCGAECWRDEHPDGYAFGSWSCSKCNWYEGIDEPEQEEEEIRLDDLPF